MAICANLFLNPIYRAEFKKFPSPSHKNGKPPVYRGSRGCLPRAEAHGHSPNLHSRLPPIGCLSCRLSDACLAAYRTPVCRKTLTVFGKTLTVCRKALTVFPRMSLRRPPFEPSSSAAHRHRTSPRLHQRTPARPCEGSVKVREPPRGAGARANPFVYWGFRKSRDGEGNFLKSALCVWI